MDHQKVLHCPNIVSMQLANKSMHVQDFHLPSTNEAIAIHAYHTQNDDPRVIDIVNSER